MMKLFVFLFFAFMIYVAFSVLRFIFRVKGHINGIKRGFSNFTETSGSAEQTPKNEKKYDKSYGEYVEYEEVSDGDSGSEQNAQAEDYYVSDSDKEGQISDAEYEEID